MTLTISLSYFDDEGDEADVLFPGRHEVCQDCEGHGTVLCEGMRYHAYSQEEFAEAFDDDEDREHYFRRGGKYDVQCPTCRGIRVVVVVDEDRLNEAQRKQLELCEEQAERAARQDAADRQTQRWENGEY